MASFKRGDFSTCNAPRSGRPKTVTTPEIIDQIHELILEDRRISAKLIAERLGISRGRVGSIIHEDVDMRNLSARWVPKCLNADQKPQQCQLSEQLLEFFSALSKWFPVAIGDHGRNVVISLWPVDKATINGVAAYRLTPPKKIPSSKTAGKFLAWLFGIKTASSTFDYLAKGQTINAEYYLSLLVQLKDILKAKSRGKVTKGALFLRDNAPANRALATQKKLTYLGFKCLDHPPYSPDLAPSGYHLFPGLKKQLIGRHFSSDTEVIAVAETWLDGQPSDFFFEWFAKVEQRAKKCIEFRVEYVELIPSFVAVTCFLPGRAKDLPAPPRT